MLLALTSTQATFTAPGQPPVVMTYDLLVGADGTGSRVRAVMQVCEHVCVHAYVSIISSSL